MAVGKVIDIVPSNPNVNLKPVVERARIIFTSLKNNLSLITLISLVSAACNVKPKGFTIPVRTTFFILCLTRNLHMLAVSGHEPGTFVDALTSNPDIFSKLIKKSSYD